MEALVAALACSFMMLPALAVFAWSALRGRHSAPDPELAALRAEVAELRPSEPGPPRDEPPGGG